MRDTYKSLPHHDCHVNCLAVANDMSTLAVAGNPLVRFYDLNAAAKDNPQPLVIYEGHTNNVTSVGFEYWGRWFYTGSEDATVKLWDCRCSGYQLCHDNLFSAIHSVVLHPNENILVFGDQAGQISFWDVTANKISQRISPERGISIKTVAVSPDAATVAAACNSGTLHMLTCKNDGIMEPSKKVIAHNGQYVLSCRFSPQAQYLATTSSNGTCNVWKNGFDGFFLGTTMAGHTSWVWDCAFSTDSSYILTASSDRTCKLWDINTGQKLLSYEGHTKAITSIVLLDFQQDVEVDSSHCD
ncbi:WD domain, G-beta repeat-containing protein [Cardiosporidium cionae]|uniref:WD domain, G-beta repeat-containing protein n=1 Tax=Cardiosporidium cionae TaxID=476202 RepID=A0ABQ7JFH4_9APIC|nr:WD domain, G-beta repeat-containing protein [Cardiosporidium cionae]|eukprot:KAF8822788.1 WD domain, G-beta repeat-containing protein [Cardiosporidium cionae]